MIEKSGIHPPGKVCRCDGKRVQPDPVLTDVVQLWITYLVYKLLLNCILVMALLSLLFRLNELEEIKVKLEAELSDLDSRVFPTSHATGELTEANKELMLLRSEVS